MSSTGCCISNPTGVTRTIYSLLQSVEGTVDSCERTRTRVYSIEYMQRRAQLPGRPRWHSIANIMRQIDLDKPMLGTEVPMLVLWSNDLDERP